MGCPSIPTGLYGMRIVESQIVPETETTRKQTKFPRSKKVRIRKKWRKDRRNFSDVITYPFYVMGDTIIMHHNNAEAVRKQLAG